MWPFLTMKKTHKCDASSRCEQVEEALHRLEIEFRRLRERVNELEGRHDSLSASMRGRLGGRPRAGAPAQERLTLPGEQQTLRSA